jgi:hypothetical protein
MDEIKNLINITDNKSSKIKLVTRGDFGDTYIQKLFDGLSAGTVTNNDEAKESIFNDLNAYNKLSNLKNELKEHLYNILFLIPIKYDDEKLKEARNQCARNYAIVKRFRNDNQTQDAFLVAKDTIKKSMKYQITELTFLLSQELMVICAIENNSRVSYYQKICRNSLKLLNAEAEAWFVLTNVYSLTSVSRQLSNSQSKKLLAEVNKFIKEFPQFDSYQINFLRFHILIVGHLLKEDHNNVIKTAKQGLKYFNTLPFTAGRVAIYSMNSRLITSNLVKGNYDEAKKAVAQALKYTEKGSHNWQVTLIFKAIIAFHSKKYAIAETAFIMANKFEMPEILKEQWRIIEAYLYFLDRIGKVNHKKRFKLSKFLNEVPTLSKDKRGANISIIIAQILIYLANNQRGKIIDKIHSLQAYGFTYLKKDYTYRSNCFIKILTQLSQGNFHRIAFERKTKLYYNYLLKHGLYVNAVERELIPFQDLYKDILSLLKEKETSYQVV